MRADDGVRQKAVDEVFSRLPKVFRTESIRAEIADNVARSKGNYEEAALMSVIGMFTSIDRALQANGRGRVLSLSSFLKKSK